MKKLFAFIGVLACIVLAMSFRGQYMGESGYVFGPYSFVQFQDSVYAVNLQYTTGVVASGNHLVSDASGNMTLQPVFSVPVLDSVTAYTGTTQTLAANTSYVLTFGGTQTKKIGTNTLSFPAGTTGQWIAVTFNTADSIITNSGTGASTVGLITATAGQTHIYYNIAGNWR